ncbi:hypothetical protein L3Q82_004317 [Scortum barcoo]|uniref:Uncharacterized protein n=1 Tax=Scortum barcoo TaxID=214431 RepID=A0ACB8VJN8_9TELE|nr:hypothetical protein L3Q82_004317 [Scortum barcoo]
MQTTITSAEEAEYWMYIHQVDRIGSLFPVCPAAEDRGPSIILLRGEEEGRGNQEEKRGKQREEFDNAIGAPLPEHEMCWVILVMKGLVTEGMETFKEVNSDPDPDHGSAGSRTVVHRPRYAKRMNLTKGVHKSPEAGRGQVVMMQTVVTAALFLLRRFIWQLNERAKAQHVCREKANASAAASNIALLCFYMQDLVLQPASEQAAGISRAASAALTRCASVPVCMVQIAAWQTMVHRNLWLNSCSPPEEHKKELLEAPISPDGLFGPHFQELVREMKTASQEAEDNRLGLSLLTPSALFRNLIPPDIYITITRKLPIN